MAEILPICRKNTIQLIDQFAISNQPEKRQGWNSRHASQNEYSKDFNS